MCQRHAPGHQAVDRESRLEHHLGAAKLALPQRIPPACSGHAATQPGQRLAALLRALAWSPFRAWRLLLAGASCTACRHVRGRLRRSPVLVAAQHAPVLRQQRQRLAVQRQRKGLHVRRAPPHAAAAKAAQGHALAADGGAGDLDARAQLPAGGRSSGLFSSERAPFRRPTQAGHQPDQRLGAAGQLPGRPAARCGPGECLAPAQPLHVGGHVGPPGAALQQDVALVAARGPAVQAQVARGGVACIAGRL
jgi:hypothetical protein